MTHLLSVESEGQSENWRSYRTLTLTTSSIDHMHKSAVSQTAEGQIIFTDVKKPVAAFVT